MQIYKLLVNNRNFSTPKLPGLFIVAINCLPFLSIGQSVVLVKDLRNFTKVWEATSPERDANVLMQKPLREVRLSATYFDGLGRPEQTVIKQGSLVTATGAAFDLVTAFEYDPYGREKNRYLPFAATPSGGLFKDSAFVLQNSFYLSALAPITGQGERTFYAVTEQEPSPLSRVTRTLAPGNSWAGAGKGVSLSYEVNTSLDSVRLWQVTEEAGDLGWYHSDTLYAPGSLYKKVITDEAGNMVVEYQDKQSKVVLKKVQESALFSEGHSGWLSTYYIYDDLDRLRAVLQPLAVEAMNNAGSWTLDATTLDELTFRYAYDSRGRMIIKKVPGAGAVFMVYDGRDRLVMTQDANMRHTGAEQWLVTGYDDWNRPVQTGLWTNNEGLSWHLGQAFNSDHYPVVTAGFELLTQTHYDDYDGLPEGLSSNLVGGYASALDAGSDAPDYAEALATSSHTKGMVTWTTTKVLGQGKYLSAVTLYDNKGRVIQTQGQNYSGGTDISTTQYDFAGKVLRTHLEHHKPGSAVPIHLATKNTYDDLGRIARIDKNINNTGYKGIAVFEYDALGQLKNKKLAPDYSNHQGLESLAYDYNIRGWLLGINRNYLKGKGSSGYDNRFFGFELGYDNAVTQAGVSFSHPQYNGNIAGTLWKSSGDEVRRKYDFTYDPVNRFGKADFTQNTDASADGPYNTEGANFSVQGSDDNALMQYDANGNILSMVQHGIKGSHPDAVIDALRYTYYPHSNKLQQVYDNNNDPHSLLGDFKYHPATKTAVDYGYDKNGNLITDLNKNLSGTTGTDLDGGGAITYNHLNLPSSIAVAGKGTIEYIYDASGTKLAKSVHETGQPDKTTLYMAAGIVYEHDSLQFLAHEEGRIRPLKDPGSYAFDYFIKDHLGNVRMVLTDEQRQDAYPVASLEQAALDSEKRYYRIPEGAVVNKANVPGYPQDDTYTAPNDYVQRLNGNGQHVGTSMVLRVMAGDKINIRASSWYRQNDVTAGNPQTAITDIVASLAQGIAGVPGGKIAAITPEQQSVLSTGVASFLSRQGDEPTPLSDKPKSYLNWLLLDEQLNPVITSDGNNSGFEPVGEDQQLTIHQVTERLLTKNGYLYIYLSNESPVDVFFDNLQVTHVRGPLLEETHYYPFGLTMAGLSSKAAGSVTNKYKFGGKELSSNDFSDGSGLELYDFAARNYDPQIGRWWSNDPKADKSVWLSPYNYCLNNPIKFFDPDGEYPYPITVRSFHPAAGFGGTVVGPGLGKNFSGDNRGFSNVVSKDVTSRVSHTVTVDPEKGSLSYSKENTFSNPSHHPYFGEATETPSGYANKTRAGNGVVSFETGYEGTNPLAYGPTPDIDFKGFFTAVQDKDMLTISMNAYGDDFPNTEMFVADPSGNTVFIGTDVRAAGEDKNPTILIGGATENIKNTSLSIKIDSKGNFVGVVQNGKTIPINDWNERFKNTNPNPQQK